MTSPTRRGVKYMTEDGSLTFKELSLENIVQVVKVNGDISWFSEEVQGLESFLERVRYCSKLKSIYLLYNARGRRLWLHKRPLKVIGLFCIASLVELSLINIRKFSRQSSASISRTISNNASSLRILNLSVESKIVFQGEYQASFETLILSNVGSTLSYFLVARFLDECVAGIEKEINISFKRRRTRDDGYARYLYGCLFRVIDSADTLDMFLVQDISLVFQEQLAFLVSLMPELHEEE